MRLLLENYPRLEELEPPPNNSAEEQAFFREIRADPDSPNFQSLRQLELAEYKLETDACCDLLKSHFGNHVLNYGLHDR